MLLEGKIIKVPYLVAIFHQGELFVREDQYEVYENQWPLTEMLRKTV